MHTTSYHSDYPVISKEVYSKSVRANPIYADNHSCNQKVLVIIHVAMITNDTSHYVLIVMPGCHGICSYNRSNNYRYWE